jgi:hypothetical protein
MENGERRAMCYKVNIDSGVEHVVVDWTALMRAQKSDLCIDTRTKVTTADIPKARRAANIPPTGPKSDQKRAVQSVVPRQFSNSCMNEHDVMKLNMWKGILFFPQAVSRLTERL